MTNPLKLIRKLDIPTPRERTQPIKSRRQRRQEERDSKALLRSADRRIKSAQVNSQRKIG